MAARAGAGLVRMAPAAFSGTSPMSVPGQQSSAFSPAALWRGAAFLLAWLALIGIGPVDIAIGIPAAAISAWVSLRLLPPGEARVSPAALALFLGRLPWQSLVAGFDVARRALSPGMPLQPGFITHATRLPPGPAREAFCAFMSLQPGSLPVSVAENGEILVHCLDVSQPAAAQFAAEEALFTRALGG